MNSFLPEFAISPLDFDRSIHINKRADILQQFGGFDARWYRDTYPDAHYSGLEPLAHFLMFGAVLGRGINDGLPRISSSPELEAALFRKPILSYCTSIMNRPDDVRGTLRENLTNNSSFSDKVEFVLIFLDGDSSFHTWVREEFATELRSGYLRVISEMQLDAWHFGRAKNAHRRFATGEIFSSLDGDNFVTHQETRQLLDIFESFGDRFVFHHFTGNWGDGSSGRVSAGMSLYEAVGYDEKFLPRQYDELDFILSTLTRHPDVPLIRFNIENHGLSSVRSKTFLKKTGLPNRIVEVEPVSRRLPLNPKEGNYVDEDQQMGVMQSFNQFNCFVKNSTSAEVRSDYIRMSHKARQQLVDIVPSENLIKMVFGSDVLNHKFPVGDNDVCTFACVKDDDLFLPEMYRHYKSIGVRYMFFVDDGSSRPIKDTLPYEDVFVVQPKIGNFVTSKTLWLETLMFGILGEGRWALTVDADELVDLPAGHGSLPELVAALDARGRDFVPALLIDMLPGALQADISGRLSPETFSNALDHYAFIESEPTERYLSAAPVRWAFGQFSRLSWSLDVRFHAFGTLDSLRKIPLSRIRHQRHLNQGFHTLHYSNDTADPDSDIWREDLILPIRHFKLLKLFSEFERDKMLSQVALSGSSQYHERTTKNILQIFGKDSASQVDRLMKEPRRPYSDGYLKSLRAADFLMR